MPTFSHSRIGTFETCPLQYKYSYIDRVEVEEEDTVETFMGSRIHEALQKLYTDLKFEKLLSLNELIEYFNKIWDENWNDNIKINRKEYTSENYRKIGIRCLTDYYNRYKPFNQGKIIGIETEETVDIDKDGKYKFHVRIDRLVDNGNGVYEIHDYKTSNSLPKQEELDNDRQLAAYSFWVRKSFKDFKEIKLIWHFLAFDKELESFRTAEQIEELRKEILQSIKEIEDAKSFEPRKSTLCDWCAYQGMCPLFKHSIELEEKTTNKFLNDPGVKLVNEYVKIKNTLKIINEEAEEKLGKLKEALIEFCKREGVSVVVGSDNRISVKEYDSVKFPGKWTPKREELVNVLKKLGRLDEVTDLDIFALARVVKNSEWPENVLEKVMQFGTIEKDYRLSVGKR